MSDQHFASDLLNEQNQLRVRFGNVNPLVLDEDLSARAQSHADDLAIRQAKLQNSSDETVGENLYYLESDDGVYEANHIVDYWLKKSNYDLDSNEKPTRTNHFTQIVWKSSEKLGVGVSKAENGAVYVVAFYYPRGNIVNYIDENVILPLVSGSEISEHSDSSETNDSSTKKSSDEGHKEKHSRKEKKPEEKVHHLLDKILKKEDKEKTGKYSLTKTKKVFQLINERFHTNYSNMDAKNFFEKLEHFDEDGKVGYKELRRALFDLNLKLEK